jgi:hypothetical protein
MANWLGATFDAHQLDWFRESKIFLGNFLETDRTGYLSVSGEGRENAAPNQLVFSIF